MGTPKTPFTLPSVPSYPGGKAADGTFQRLINDIPPHDNYVEPFLGGGSILRHKRPAESINLGIEVDADLAAIWAREAPAWVKVKHGCGLDYLESLVATAVDDDTAYDSTFLFIDPPYINETLSNGRAPYANRFSYDDHIRLLFALKMLAKHSGAMVMVCALPNVLYDNQLTGWRTFQYESKGRRGGYTEQVWMNYDRPDVLHDTRYVGETYRDRERIKRNGKGIIRRLERLPSIERQAILETLKAKYP